MGRRRRPQMKDGTYHVTSRGIRKQAIFGDATDRRLWLATLADVVTICGWICHSYCQMTNHFHLCIETPNANIAAGMHRLNSEHAHWFNSRYGFTGHVFEARYDARVIETDEYFIDLARYVALNPVRARMCANAHDWPWSSYAGTIGETVQLPFVSDRRVLSHFDDDRIRARTLLRAFVEAGKRDATERGMSVPGTDMTGKGMTVTDVAA